MIAPTLPPSHSHPRFPPGEDTLPPLLSYSPPLAAFDAGSHANLPTNHRPTRGAASRPARVTSAPLQAGRCGLCLLSPRARGTGRCVPLARRHRGASSKKNKQKQARHQPRSSASTSRPPGLVDVGTDVSIESPSAGPPGDFFSSFARGLQTASRPSAPCPPVVLEDSTPGTGLARPAGCTLRESCPSREKNKPSCRERRARVVVWRGRCVETSGETHANLMAMPALSHTASQACGPADQLCQRAHGAAPVDEGVVARAIGRAHTGSRPSPLTPPPLPTNKTHSG